MPERNSGEQRSAPLFGTYGSDLFAEFLFELRQRQPRKTEKLFTVRSWIRVEPVNAVFSLLKPEDIGVELTDGCMMEPEASVSALVFHHPAAFYYSVS